MKKSKYGNKKVTAMGRKFDSIGERDRYFYLSEAQRRGEIKNLRCQVKFPMVVNDLHVCDYFADFVYEKHTSPRLVINKSEARLCNLDLVDFVEIIEDFKGVQTDVFKLKRKLMRACHGQEIKIVKKPTDPV